MTDAERAWLCCSAVAMMLASGAPDARAQPAPPQAAEALFVEGKWLMGAGEYTRACAKFAESEQLDPAAGTLMNLADCYEKNGQLASAWVTFREATTAAERNGRRAWAEQAAARARLLEPRLPTLTIEIDPAHAGGVEITRDGALVPPTAWGSPVPVDPSTSRIEARAPNKKGWTTTVTVDADHPHVNVAVPPLEDLLAPQAEAVPEKAQPTHQKGVATAPRSLVGPLTLGALGAAGLVAGTYFGIRTFDLRDTSSAECVRGCTDLARQTRSQAQTSADIATVAFVAGGVSLAAGVTWWWLGRTAATHSATVRVLPLIGDANGIALTGEL